MSKKKEAVTETTKPASTTSLANYNERLATLAKMQKKAVSNVGSTTNFISLKGGVMSWKGAPVPDNKLKCVILLNIPENQFYVGNYDPENFTAPRCYAFGKLGEDPDTMAPNPEYVKEPINVDCASCPNNEWGSSDVGRGKACKEVQRLALVAATDELEESEIGYLKVSVTSTKHWASYIRELDAQSKATIQAVTEIAVVKDTDGSLPGWHLAFTHVQFIEDSDVLGVLFKKFDKAAIEIAQPYPELDAVPQKPKKAAVGRGAATPVPQRSVTPPAPVKVGLGKNKPQKASKY